MAFRPKKKQPQFADLKGSLSQSKQTDNALYQTVQLLIERLSQFQSDVNEDVQQLDPTNANSIAATKFATYHTKNFEVGALPNSWQLLAGAGIVFDDSVPHKRVISTGLGNHYDAPLSDGDLIAADLIYAAGECIIVQVPIP